MGTFIDLMSVDLLRAPVGSPASNIPTHMSPAANSIPVMSGANTEQRFARFQDLVDLLLSVPKSNFDPFHVHRTSYRSAGRDIGTDVLVSKRPFTGTSRPVMVRIHGGFLVSISCNPTSVSILHSRLTLGHWFKLYVSELPRSTVGLPTLT